MADRTTKTTPQPCLTLTPPEAPLTQCGRRKHLNHWGHHCTSTRNTRTGQGAQMDEKTNHANAQARLEPACRPWCKPNKGIRDSHHTSLMASTSRASSCKGRNMTMRSKMSPRSVRSRLQV